jgi:hypothetical protein
MVIAKRIGNAITAVVTSLSLALSSAAETGFLFAGAALVSYGVYEIYRPAGLITAGVLLIAGTILKAA